MEPDYSFSHNMVCGYSNSMELDSSFDTQTSELSKRIEKIIGKWFCAHENKLTSEKLEKLYAKTRAVTNDLVTLYNSGKLQQAQNLSADILGQLKLHSKRDYEVLMPAIFISPSFYLGGCSANKDWHYLYSTLNHIYLESINLAYDYSQSSDPDLCGIPLYHKCLNDYVHEMKISTINNKMASCTNETKEALTSKNDKHLLLIEDIWNKNISSYLELEDVLTLRVASKLTRMIGNEFLINKLPIEQLLELCVDVNYHCVNTLSNCPDNLQIMNRLLFLREIVRRFNTKEMATYDLFDSPELEFIGSIEDLSAFFGEERNQVHVLGFDCSFPICQQDLNKIHKSFPNLIEMEFLYCLGYSTPDETEIFNAIKFLHLWEVSEPDILNNLLKFFPNLTELTCNKFETNVFDCIKDHASLQKITITEGCIWAASDDNREKIILPSITHLRVMASDIDTTNLNLPSLTHMHIEKSEINPDFLKNSPNLETVCIKDCWPMDLSFLKPSKVKTLTLINEKWASGFNEIAFGTLNKLLDLPTIETLRIEGMEVSDFGVLCKHENLKTLYLKDCTNMHTAKVLEDKGVQVFYEVTVESSTSMDFEDKNA